MSQQTALRVRWLLILALVALLLIVAPEPNDTRAVQAFQLGTHLALSEGLSPDQASPSQATAASALRHAIERRPRDPQPWQALGDLYTLHGGIDQALEAHNQAQRRPGAGATLERSRARWHALAGDPAAAARDYAGYLAQRPDDRAARLALAQVCIWLGEWNHARAELEFLQATQPTDLETQAWLGLLLVGPEPETGLSHLRRSADDPALASVSAPLVDAQHLGIAIEDPAYRWGLLGVAFLNLDLSPLKQLSDPTSGIGERLDQVTARLAIHALRAAVYQNPLYAEAYAYLGQAADTLGWSDWALASLHYAESLAPDSLTIQTLSGLYWDRHGAPALARQHYEAAYHQDKDNATLCLEIAATYAAENEYTAAEVWLLYAAEIAPDNPQVWESLTRFYVDSDIGVKQSGIAAAQRLVELAPHSASAYDLLGWAYYLTGDYVRARTYLLRALSLGPGLAPVHYHLGRLYAQDREYENAAQAYRRAADLDLEGRWKDALDRAWSELASETATSR
jgi:tetratricopeptide (TPR) repeat protein